jgi:hypothetical protein
MTGLLPYPHKSVLTSSRIPRADGAGVRVHVAAGAVVVAGSVVRVGRDVGCHVGAVAGRVPLDGVAVRIRARAVAARVLRLCGGRGQRQRGSQNDLLHSQSPHLVFWCAATHHSGRGLSNE